MNPLIKVEREDEVEMGDCIENKVFVFEQTMKMNCQVQMRVFGMQSNKVDYQVAA